jgi:Protein phosphatase 2C
MTSTRDAGAWRVMTGTARGITHEARGRPNQDSVASRAIAGATGVVVAVADGHGHGRHFRSATGSELAVGTACAVVDQIVAEGHPSPWRAEQAGTLRDMLPEAILAQWRESVARDIAASPYTDEELATLEAAGDGPEIPYGATLLVALLAGDWLICVQIGDGDMLAVRPDGRAWFPVGTDELLDGYRTTSLCQPGALRSFRAAAHDLRAEPLLALLLSTDGYGNAQVKDPWQPSVAQDLAELAAGHDHGWFARQVPVWAERCASAEGSGDDTTIGLLLAPGSERLAASAARSSAPAGTGAVTTPVPAPAPPEEPAAEPERQAPRSTHRAPGTARPGRRRAAIAAAAVVVAAGAVTGALVVTQSSGSGPSAPDRHPAGPAAGHVSPAPSPSASGAVPSADTAPVKPRATGDAVPSQAASPTSTSPAAGSPGVHDGTPGVTSGLPAGGGGQSNNQEG